MIPVCEAKDLKLYQYHILSISAVLKSLEKKTYTYKWISSICTDLHRFLYQFIGITQNERHMKERETETKQRMVDTFALSSVLLFKSIIKVLKWFLHLWHNDATGDLILSLSTTFAPGYTTAALLIDNCSFPSSSCCY